MTWNIGVPPPGRKPCFKEFHHWSLKGVVSWKKLSRSWSVKGVVSWKTCREVSGLSVWNPALPQSVRQFVEHARCSYSRWWKKYQYGATCTCMISRSWDIIVADSTTIVHCILGEKFLPNFISSNFWPESTAKHNNCTWLYLHQCLSNKANHVLI